MANAIAAWQTGLRSVLIASDFSGASTKPLLHALAIARHYHAKFFLVHVVSSLGFTIAGAQAKGLAFEAAQQDARRLEEELIASGRWRGWSMNSSSAKERSGQS